MEKIVLQAANREIVGKKVKMLRREGKIPGIIYGKDLKKPLPITLDLRETTKFMRGVTPSTVVTIKVDGKDYTTLVRDRQRDVLLGNYIHIDFMAISLKDKVRTLVNLFLEGEAPAVEDWGATIILSLDQIEVETLPQDLPESIVVDISNMANIGDAIHVKDLAMPEGVECLSDPEELIVVASAPELEPEEEEEEELEEELLEGVEPEVIEKGKREEEEEEEN